MSVAERLERIRSGIPMETSDAQRERLSDARKPSVLYVDDEPVLRELVQAILGEDSRFRLIVAEDGAEGLAEAQLHRPELVLLDVQMPRLNGYEVCAALRSGEATKDATIIMVTALGGRSDVDRGFAAGADDYFPKPFRYRNLVAKVEQFLGLVPLAAAV